MNNDIQDLNLSDVKMAAMDVDMFKKIIEFSLPSVFLISYNRYIRDVRIKIFNWRSINIKQHISTEPFTTNREITITDAKEIETFEMIQEHYIKDQILVLSGFSKQSGNWMTYDIT